MRRASLSDRHNMCRKEYETEAIVWRGGREEERKEEEKEERKEQGKEERKEPEPELESSLMVSGEPFLNSSPVDSSFCSVY